MRYFNHRKQVERMLKLLIRLGFHGKRHNMALQKLETWMHDNGLGA